MLPTLKPTSQPPVVLSGLHYDSTPNTVLFPTAVQNKIMTISIA